MTGGRVFSFHFISVQFISTLLLSLLFLSPVLSAKALIVIMRVRVSVVVSY